MDLIRPLDLTLFPPFSLILAVRIHTRSVNSGKISLSCISALGPKLWNTLRGLPRNLVIALMICGTFTNDRRLVSRRDTRKRHSGEKRERRKKRNSAVAINTACSPTGNTRHARAFRTKIIATERREAAGSIRAVYNRQLKLALQQVILVHAVLPAIPAPRNSEFWLEAANHAPEIVMLVIVRVTLHTVIIPSRIDFSAWLIIISPRIGISHRWASSFANFNFDICTRVEPYIQTKITYL